jgi:AraC-like DNA-binding protein
LISKDKYASSSLKNEDQIAEIKQKILDYIEIEKPFLNAKFNMFDFSRALGINYKYISQVINEEFGKNFIVFINERRVEEAKKLLLDDKNKYLSVEEIAIQAGFQTPSTFYVNFKKYTSTTPSNYRLRTN